MSNRSKSITNGSRTQLYRDPTIYYTSEHPVTNIPTPKISTDGRGRARSATIENQPVLGNIGGGEFVHNGGPRGNVKGEEPPSEESDSEESNSGESSGGSSGESRRSRGSRRSKGSRRASENQRTIDSRQTSRPRQSIDSGEIRQNLVLEGRASHQDFEEVFSWFIDVGQSRQNSVESELGHNIEGGEFHRGLKTGQFRRNVDLESIDSRQSIDSGEFPQHLDLERIDSRQSFESGGMSPNTDLESRGSHQDLEELFPCFAGVGRSRQVNKGSELRRNIENWQSRQNYIESRESLHMAGSGVSPGKAESGMPPEKVESEVPTELVGGGFPRKIEGGGSPESVASAVPPDKVVKSVAPEKVESAVKESPEKAGLGFSQKVESRGPPQKVESRGSLPNFESGGSPQKFEGGKSPQKGKGGKSPQKVDVGVKKGPFNFLGRIIRRVRNLF